MDKSGNRDVVRVFISSTFRDMHAERDHLVKAVFPQLRHELAFHSLQLVDIDLRWGVTREQAENGQILDLCLEQIDAARPFFIGLLGQRYGRIPDAYPETALCRQGWLGQAGRKSITELEILHGVLNNPTMHLRAGFFFRDDAAVDSIPEPVRSEVYKESAPEAVAKLKDLKDRIRNSNLHLVDGYHAHWEPEALERASKSKGRLVELEAFGKAVHDFLWNAIREEFDLPEKASVPDPLMEYISAGMEAVGDSKNGKPVLIENFSFMGQAVQSHLQAYVPRPVQQRALHDYLVGEQRRPLVLSGPEGSGKSAMLAWLTNDLERRHPEVQVVPWFVGAGPWSSPIRYPLRRFIVMIRVTYDLDTENSVTTPAIMQLFRQLVDRIPAGRPLVLILDGLDQMDLRHHPEELSWLPERLPPNVKMILSCRNGQGPWERGLRRCREQGFPQLAMPPLAFGELREVIRTVPLISAKALDAEQIDMLAGNPAAANPLFLLTALEELRGFGSFAHLNDRIAAFPRPEGQEDDPLGRLFGQLVERLSQEFDPATSECLLSLLACARNGLTEEELQELVATDDLAFVLHQLRPYLQRHDGRHLGFRHTALRHAVSNAYLAEEDTRRKWHRLLADYFEAQPPSLARTQELPHHLEQAAEWDRLIRFLTDPEVLASYDGGSPEYKAEMEADIKALWTRIEAVTAHRMTEAYAAYIESPREHGKTALFVGHLLADAGHVREARRLVDSALELSERGPERANALNHRAGLYIRQGQFALALDMYAEAEAILTEAGDNKVLASVLANRAIAYMGLGEHQEALSIWREQENGYRQSGNDVNLAVCLGGQGTALAAMGDLHGALALHQEEEGLCRRAGDKHGLQRSLGNQGIIHAKLANEERAAELMAEQARISAELGDRLQEAIALNNQANILKRDGDLDRAQESFRKAASVFRELGDKSALAQALDNLALNQTGEDGVARALELHAEAEALFRETGDRNGLTICLYNQTHARMRAGHKQEALENAEQAAVLAKEIGNAQVRLWSLQVAYNLTMQWGERDRALAFLSEAVQVARDMGQQQGLGEMLAVLGQMSFQAGDIGEARAHFEEAMTVLPRSDRALMQVMMGLSRIMTPHIKPEVNFNAATSGFRDVLEANPDLAKRIAELDRAAQDLLTQKGDYMGAVEVSEKQEQALREAVPGASFDGLLQHQYFLVTALEMAVESDLEKAVACMEKRQAICLRARDYPTRARVLVEMVQRLVAARQVERALEALDRLEGTHGALGNSRKVAETLRQRCDLLGASEIRDERYGSALARSVEAAKQEGNSDAAGRDLLMLAGWLRSRRDYGKALARYREAETCFQEAENALQAEVARANQRLVFTDMGQSGAPPEPKD